MSIIHGLSPFWAAVASAPTSAAAVTCAVKRVRPHDMARVPRDIEGLPARARLNVDAALRVLEIGPYAETPPTPTATVNAKPAEDRSVRRRITHIITPAQSQSNDAEMARPPSPPKQKPTDDPALRNHVANLRRWAAESAHTAPPTAAIRAVCAVPDIAPLLLPASTSAAAAAALVSATAEHGGALFAASMCAPLSALLRALSAPAPRDLLGALERLAALHPGSALALFHAPGAFPAAEALARVAAHLPPRDAAAALAQLCDAGAWGEPDVKLVDAVLARCKSDPGVGDTLVAGLERHVGELEKSIRFGKLLLTAVRDVDGVKDRHAAVIRNVASRSTVFLAKRAAKLLPEPS